MKIAARAVEPEYVKVRDLGHGVASIEMEIADVSISGLPNGVIVRTSEIEIILMASDVENVRRELNHMLVRDRLDKGS